jgi:hypothetical protein
MFGSMMQKFFNDMSDEDKQRMNACCEKTITMCPCGSMKVMSEKDRKAMMEKMKSICGDKMETMFFFSGCEGSSK